MLSFLTLLGCITQAFANNTLVYLQQEVKSSAVFDYMPPLDTPIYLPNGPYLITRGLGDSIYYSRNPLTGLCTGFIVDSNHRHGKNQLILQSKDGRVGISLAGPSAIGDPNYHLISALYVDYFSTGDDIRPWLNTDALILQAYVSVPQVELEDGDIGYVQYSILLEDTQSHQFVWWVWQLYDNRLDKAYEGIGVDTTIDGGGYSFVATAFAETGLQYSTTMLGSTYFQYVPWKELAWFGSKITRQNFINGVNAIIAAYPQNAGLSSNPDNYLLRKFYYYSEIYLQHPLTSKSRICTQSYRALLRTE